MKNYFKTKKDRAWFSRNVATYSFSLTTFRRDLKTILFRSSFDLH